MSHAFRLIAIGGLLPLILSANLISDDSKAANLRLDLTIIGEKNCSGDADVYSTVLDLSTRYTNEGNEPIVLFRGSDVPAASFVARSPEDLKTGKYESTANWHVIPSRSEEFLIGQNPSDQHRTILQPGDTAEGENKAALLVRKRDTDRIPGTISAGQHYAQFRMLLKISPHPEEHASRKKVSYRWIYVLSNPIEISVNSNPELQVCSAQN